MNLVSIGASFGVVVWVFQDGHLSPIAGLHADRVHRAEQPDHHAGGAVRAGHRLRGVPAVAGPRGVGPHRRQHRLGGGRPAAHRPHHHRGGAAARRGGGRLRHRRHRVHQADRRRHDRGDRRRRDAGARCCWCRRRCGCSGRWNWWAPAPLARLYRRFGIRESDAESAAGPPGSSPTRPPPAANRRAPRQPARRAARTRRAHAPRQPARRASPRAAPCARAASGCTHASRSAVRTRRASGRAACPRSRLAAIARTAPLRAAHAPRRAARTRRVRRCARVARLVGPRARSLRSRP